MTNRAEQLLREARQFLVAGESKQKAADADKWSAAERMWKANREEGVAIRDIAEAVGRSPTSVSEHVSLYERETDSGVRVPERSFTDAYYDFKPATAPETRRAGHVVEHVLREQPELVAEKLSEASPESRLRFSKAQAKHYDEVNERSQQKFREIVGEDNAAALDQTQELRDAEHELVRARSALAGFLKRANDLEGDRPDMWVRHCRDWLDDISEKVELSRGLLDGGDIDDAIERMLAGEV